jgi:phosphatidate phosphatase APP1
MKKLIFIFSLLFSLNTFASISIVSDLDDTIKITNSGSEIEGGISAFLKNDVFTGIPEFFSAARLYTNELHVLSASPKILRGKITSTLNGKQIKFESLILKEGSQSKFDYKVGELKKLLTASPDDFIFVGDDVGQDPEAYLEIKRLFPNRVLAVYIHVINGRDIPASAVKFWTSFDLFMREQIAGRMLPSYVGFAAELTLREKKMKFIFPDFAKCPTTDESYSWQLSTEFIKIAKEVSEKLTNYCLSRSSGN